MDDDGDRRRNVPGGANQAIIFGLRREGARLHGSYTHGKVLGSVPCCLGRLEEALVQDALALSTFATKGRFTGLGGGSAAAPVSNRAVTLFSRSATSPSISPAALSTWRMAASACCLSSIPGGSNRGMAARAASGSSSIRKNCSRAIALNCASVSRWLSSTSLIWRSAWTPRSSTLPRGEPA